LRRLPRQPRQPLLPQFSRAFYISACQAQLLLSRPRSPQHACEMDELNEATILLDVQEACDYKYAPLQHPDSIRLLVLMPGEMDSPIRTYLAEYRLQENPWYEAVSYTWANEEGDCSLSSQIKCGDARLWVTKNCELALRYLRETDSEVTLWVDAICL
jgi:hypothetical protein